MLGEQEGALSEGVGNAIDANDMKDNAKAAKDIKEKKPAGPSATEIAKAARENAKKKK